MHSFFASLPQGLYWYPLITGLLIYAGVVLTRTSKGAKRRRRKSTIVESGNSYTSLIARARADRFSELELERLCLSFLLQASGFSGYSTAHCRAYLQDASDVGLILAIQEHLGDAPAKKRAAVASDDPRLAPLPPRCQLFVKQLQEVIEESHEHTFV